MKTSAISTVILVSIASACIQTTCFAEAVFESDFSEGDFAALGWKSKGGWDVFTYPKETANNPGAVALFAA